MRSSHIQENQLLSGLVYVVFTLSYKKDKISRNRQLLIVNSIALKNLVNIFCLFTAYINLPIFLLTSVEIC